MEKETIIYDILEASDIALTCRQIFERGAKDYYSMEELSRLLYELRQQGVIFHGRKVENKHTYLIPDSEKTNIILGDKPVAKDNNVQEIIEQELSNIRFCDHEIDKLEVKDLLVAINTGLPFIQERMPRYSEYLSRAVTLLEKLQ